MKLRKETLLDRFSFFSYLLGASRTIEEEEEEEATNSGAGNLPIAHEQLARPANDLFCQLTFIDIDILEFRRYMANIFNNSDCC